MLSRLVLFGVLLALGCGHESSRSESPMTFEPLVMLEQWQPVALRDDPFVTDAELVTECSSSGVALEDQWLELDTGLCNWITLTAPARFAVEPGQELRLVVSHFDLNAPSAAEGVVELTFDRCSAWSKVVAIPAPAAVYTESFRSPCAIAETDIVHFHLHNHGQNNWQLQELSVEQ